MRAEKRDSSLLRILAPGPHSGRHRRSRSSAGLPCERSGRLTLAAGQLVQALANALAAAVARVVQVVDQRGEPIAILAPSAKLGELQVPAWTPTRSLTEVALPSGRTASVLSRVDVLLDRLDELQATGHLIVGQQVLALLAGMSDTEAADLEARAATRRVTTILATMRALADEIASGRREPPESDELHEIAQTALNDEYAPRRP